MKNDLIDLCATVTISLIVLAIPPLFIWMAWQHIAVKAFRLPALSYLQCFWLNIGVKALLGKFQINMNNRKDNDDNE